MSAIKIVKFDGFWTVKNVNAQLNALWLFGDNDQRYGMKGQAIIRKCKNAYGIPTKKKPSMNAEAFYTDD